MPWPKDHKARTRERIVQAAADAFRGRGVSGVRVEEVMADAGLTHGGFYAHFASKEELVGAALRQAAVETLERLGQAAGAVEPERRLLAAAEAYLSAAHAAHPEHGCPVAALGPEIARAGGAGRRALAAGLRERLAWMRALLPRRRGRAQEEQVIGTLACMIGGLVLARALGGDDAQAVLAACRGFLRHALEPPARGSRADDKHT